MTDPSLIADFADEAREHLEELEGALLRLENDPTDAELLNTIFRSMHTIKGASEYLGFERIAGLTHHLETLLDFFREGQLSVDKVAVDVLIDARDRIESLIGEIEASGRESTIIDDLLERAAALGSGTQPGGAASVFPEEADTELFDIFAEQLVEGLVELVRSAGDDVTALDSLVGQLSTSANYMGYDGLVAVYDDLAGELSATDAPAAAVATAVERIRQLFPTVEALGAIDTDTIRNPGKSDGDLSVSSDSGPDDLPAAAATGADQDPDSEPDLCLDGDPILGDQSNGDAEDRSDPYPGTGETDPSLIADFADEAREHLEELEGALLRLENDPTDAELLNTIFRSMHTIKGASEYLGFERIAGLTHHLETLLDFFREGQLSVDKVAVDVLIDARDRIESLIGEIEASGRESTIIDDLLERAAALGSGTQPGGAASVFPEEADTELFDIFAEQLVEGLVELVRSAGDDVTALDSLVGQLSTSANYMGYDGLVAVYDDLAGELSATDAPAAAVATAVERIRQLFPTVEALGSLDTSALSDASPVVDACETVPVPADPDLAEALASLPSIDEDQRAGLLSRSLDEVFATMQGRGDRPEDSDAAEGTYTELDVLTPAVADADMQDTPPVPVADGEDDTALALLTDFGRERTSENVEYPVSVEDGVGDGPLVDLWPEAAPASAPDPETVRNDSEVPPENADPVLTVPDFNTPPAPSTPAGSPTEADGPTAPVAARSNIRRSIRVEARKIDDLMNQVGELVVNRSAFVQLFSDMRELIIDFNQRFPMEKGDHQMLAGLTNRLSEATTVLGRVTGELQEQVMKVRMLPISRLFNRYPRLVHDLSKDTDKKVQLQFRGEETELDRMVIEQLADPMIHIIRNAVDHGLETRDERQRKGKPESGVLLLEAYHEGGNVIIEVIDDGKGIDLSRIRQKAIEKKLADRDTLDRMDQRQLIEMILLPGFSTTDAVTHTSGRGVGMDVVKQSLEKINGSLSIDTRQDVGTRIRIKIPLTLAIIPALMIRCAGGHFTIPLGSVRETLRIDQGEIFSVDGSEVMDLEDEPLPLVNLAELLRMIPRGHTMPQGRRFVVVVNAASGRTGFVVDALLGRQEVVIKPLEDYLQENSGFSGATILGDGGISLILNVDELAVMAKEREAERKLAAALL